MVIESSADQYDSVGAGCGYTDGRARDMPAREMTVGGRGVRWIRKSQVGEIDTRMCLIFITPFASAQKLCPAPLEDGELARVESGDRLDL